MSQYEKYELQVISFENGEVIKRIPCNGKRMADKADAGMNINLNHDEYYTDVVKLES